MDEVFDVGDMDGAVRKNAPKRKKVLVKNRGRIAMIEVYPYFVCSLQPPAPTKNEEPPAPKEPEA